MPAPVGGGPKAASVSWLGLALGLGVGVGARARLRARLRVKVGVGVRVRVRVEGGVGRLRVGKQSMPCYGYTHYGCMST